MTIERIPIESREQWLAMRRQDVTASAIGALLGVSEYQTRYGLWALKSGLMEDETDEPVVDDCSITISPMARGTLFEDKAGELLRTLKPSWIVKRCSEYYRDSDARLGATPDFLANDGEALCVIQVKNPEQSIYRKKWRREDGAIEPPLEYVAQAIVEAHLTGASRAYVGALIIGHRTEFRLIEVPIHRALIDRIRADVAEFWAMVEDKTPPTWDYSRDGEMIAKLYGADNERVIDLTGWNEAGSLAAEYAELSSRMGADDKRKKAIKAEVMHKMAGHGVAMIDGRVFAAAKTVNKKPYSVAASSYPLLTIKKEASNGSINAKKSAARAQQSADPFGAAF